MTRTAVVDCADGHKLEVVYVGRLGDAVGATVPPDDSDDVRSAFAQCGRAASEYLGGDWHDGRTTVLYSPPSPAQWQGGARFFWCSVFETLSMQGGAKVRTSTIKGALGGDQPAAMACFTEIGALNSDGLYLDGPDGFFPAGVSDLHASSCDQPHTAEYAGRYYPPSGPYPTGGDLDKVGQGCDPVVAGFLGLSQTGFGDRHDIRYLAWPQNKFLWKLGDQSLACFAVVSTKNPVRGSLKGIGSRPLPQ